MFFLELVLILATLLCALTAGLVFAFASVVMPGIGKLGDREFIRSFQVIDGWVLLSTRCDTMALPMPIKR